LPLKFITHSKDFEVSIFRPGATPLLAKSNSISNTKLHAQISILCYTFSSNSFMFLNPPVIISFKVVNTGNCVVGTSWT
jgi:hypothetical protein